MSTSRLQGRDGESGFSVIEMLIGLGLTLLIALAALSLWEGIQRAGVDDGDRMIRLIQGRVAVARLGRDLRLATARGCGFTITSALLEAKPNQVVLLTRSGQTGDLALVEWELVGGNLMRRKGACPQVQPPVVEHALFMDNKTMLEGMRPESRFRYFIAGCEMQSPLSVEELSRVDEVELAAAAGLYGSRVAVSVVGRGLVGR